MNTAHITDPNAAIQYARHICASEKLNARIDGCVRFQKGRYAILEGLLQETPAIFRVALSERAQQELATTWAEIERIGPHMAGGPYQVAQGFSFSTSGGLLITERANGAPYLETLKQSSESEHADRLANWLAQYANPTVEWRKAGPSHWIKQAQKSSAQQPHDILRQKELMILDRMTDLAAQIGSNKWRIAITHGDYHPNNLVWDGQVLTGIDIGGSATLPIYKDMARSLVHLARRDIILGSEARYGMDKSLIEAFTHSFKLSEHEVNSCLPFFVGFECLIKVEQPNAPAWRLKAAERMYDQFLKEFS